MAQIDCEKDALVGGAAGGGGGGEKGGRGGFWSSVFTVFNSTVGTGILTLPFSFRMHGVVGLYWVTP
ncbi:hypothetical protein DIPPA_05800 [Diplonema papillatum]|nr:hypothetical protein DIPPA_05800 [Diplonema papillatum]